MKLVQAIVLNWLLTMTAAATANDEWKGHEPEAKKEEIRPFECDNGVLKPANWQCDGKDDCGDNSDEKDCPSGGSCFFEGTRITLTGGEEMVVEKQVFGQKLISNAGEITTVTGEYVENEMENGGQLFGINNDDPFATLNHPFWTIKGWKSLDIEAAKEENPHVEYGELQIGDTVFRIAQADPLMYEPTQISHFTVTTFFEPFKTYGLHLNGPQSYHANGYVVAANYPILTKKRVGEGKKRLSEGEKEGLKSAIDSGEMEVVKVLGKWASAFLDDGLGNKMPIGDN